jgi:hypothetical protein
MRLSPKSTHVELILIKFYTGEIYTPYLILQYLQKKQKLTLTNRIHRVSETSLRSCCSLLFTVRQVEGSGFLVGGRVLEAPDTSRTAHKACVCETGLLESLFISNMVQV